jgi:cytochrome P450
MQSPDATCPLRFDPLSPEQLRDPYPLYARARAEQPVFHSEAHDLWVVTRHEDVVAVVRDHATFSSANAVRSSLSEPAPEVLAVLAEGHPLGPTLTDSDEPIHRRLRGLVNKAFTHRRVADLEPLVRATANELIDGFAADGRADLIDRFGWSLPLAAIAAILDVPRADLPRLHRWSYDWLQLLQATGSVAEQVDQARSVVAMQRYFLDALEARAQEPGEDLMSALLAARLEGEQPLTLVEAMRVPMNLVIAGHVTVTRAIGNGVVLLLEHPDQLARLRAGPDSVAGAVEELLRVESPAQGLFRTTTRDVTVGGVRLPAGARVMVHYGSANRDEAVFAGADRLDLARDDVMRHVAFGKGIHACVGAPLARLELRVALPLLFERLPGLRLRAQDATERDTIFFARGFKHVHVEWDPAGAP